MATCNEGRGCPCDYHVKRRQYARQRYAEKYKGAPRNRATGLTEKASTRNQKSGTRMEPRFMESVVGDITVFHLMPKEGEWWNCPDCGSYFERSEEGWALAGFK